ncbi:MAG: DUF72 domain-containing protein [Candidatus Aenigmatarchaeota archaeon]
MIHIGCCGYSYMRPSEFFGENWKKSFRSVLQAYVKLFDSVEINSSFYKIPKISTAEKWRKEANEINKNFIFTVKASNIITHIDKFSGRSVWAFNQMKEICKALNAKILLLQSPNSWKPSEENIEKMESFFNKIKREKITITWEPRGKWWDEPNLIKEVCKKFNLINCVDPFRNEALYFGKEKIAYFRLHGFGLLSMYHYNFSKKELEGLKEKIKSLYVREIYIMFNNAWCYSNALEFKKLLNL